MRRHATKVFTLALSTATWAMLALPQTVHAQQETSLESENDGLIKLSFEGGTLKEFLDVVNDTYKEKTYISLSPEIATYRLPPIVYKVTLKNFPVTLLQTMAPGRLRIDSIGVDGNSYIILPPVTETQVYAVRKLIGNKSGAEQARAVELLISAIQEALKLGVLTVPEVKMKVHLETGLLLVSGTQEQTGVVRQVVTQLHEAGPLLVAP